VDAISRAKDSHDPTTRAPSSPAALSRVATSTPGPGDACHAGGAGPYLPPVARADLATRHAVGARLHDRIERRSVDPISSASRAHAAGPRAAPAGAGRRRGSRGQRRCLGAARQVTLEEFPPAGVRGRWAAAPLTPAMTTGRVASAWMREPRGHLRPTGTPSSAQRRSFFASSSSRRTSRMFHSAGSWQPLSPGHQTPGPVGSREGGA
jgi:hypothetical protein